MNQEPGHYDHEKALAEAREAAKASNAIILLLSKGMRKEALSLCHILAEDLEDDGTSRGREEIINAMMAAVEEISTFQDDDLRCPWCGSYTTTLMWGRPSLYPRHYVLCDNGSCDARGPLCSTEDEAEDAWRSIHFDKRYD